MPQIPGFKAAHFVIGDACRTHWGSDQAAWEEAVRRLKEVYEGAAQGYPEGQGHAFHLVLTIDRNSNTN